MRIVSKLALMLFILMLAACGGDSGFVASDDAGNDPDDGGGGDPETIVASISLLSSNPQLATGDDTGVTITAIVRDAGNLVLEGKTVTFGATSGALQVVSATTNAEGIATAKLTSGGNEQNRTITVSAVSGNVTRSINIEVAGTAITVAGQSSMVMTATNTLTLTLKDSFGVGIFNEDLAITSTQSPTLTESGNLSNTGTGSLTVVTNSSGQAQVDLKPNNSGNHTVTVSALGTTKTHAITVSNDVFELILPNNPAREANLGADETVQITYENNSGRVPNQTINFVTTRGGFGANKTPSATATTNANGVAAVSISSLNSGPATIQAYVSGGPSTTLTVEFIATATATLELQTSLSTVGLGGGEATITATVRDANNNLVKNKPVNFSLIDITGGTLSAATDTTDSNGQATTVYKSAANASAKDGVKITATVDDGSNVTGNVSLTVGNRALFITLGSGNEMLEPDMTNYQKPFTVRVADAAGAGVANVQVSLALIPERYFKGYYDWDPVGKVHYVIYTIDTTRHCQNEDENGNGIYESGIDEDENTDGILWPGTVATVSSGTVTTDAQGEADFTVNYSQEYANFVFVRLEATATVGGTEAKNMSRFRLPVLADDVTDEDVAPPGREIDSYIASPFGYATACSSTN